MEEVTHTVDTADDFDVKAESFEQCSMLANRQAGSIVRFDASLLARWRNLLTWSYYRLVHVVDFVVPVGKQFGACKMPDSILLV